ncbi:hypothetical protein BKA93DRAFT_786298 [Sparassis latifolia]
MKKKSPRSRRASGLQRAQTRTLRIAITAYHPCNSMEEDDAAEVPPMPSLREFARQGLRTLDIVELLLSAPNQSLDNDPLRARTLLAGLEVVPDDLVRRYENLKRGFGDDSDGCVICRDDLLPRSPSPLSREAEALAVVELFSVLPFQPSPQIIRAFPCPGKHLFHHDCLAPWLARKTTCPTCRFDIDPHSLTLRKSTTPRRASRSSPERVWKPPRVRSLGEWLEDEEYFRKHGVRKEKPSDAVTEGVSAAFADDELEADEDEWVDTDEDLPGERALRRSLQNVLDPPEELRMRFRSEMRSMLDVSLPLGDQHWDTGFRSGQSNH